MRELADIRTRHAIESVSEILARHATDKGPTFHDYGRQYDQLFHSRRYLPIRVLEIGVARGDSLRAWREVFPNAEVIVGLDCDDRCAVHTCPDRKIFVEIGNATDPNSLRVLRERYASFDLIIDDGCHLNETVIRTFESLFPHLLAEEGLYVVEDTACWKSELYVASGIPHHLEYFWRLTEHLNQWRFDSHTGPKDHCVDPFKIQKKSADKLECGIDRIEFGCSFIAVHKKTRNHWVLEDTSGAEIERRR